MATNKILIVEGIKFSYSLFSSENINPKGLDLIQTN